MVRQILQSDESIHKEIVLIQENNRKAFHFDAMYQ